MVSSGCTSTSTPGLTFALSDPFTGTDSCQISGYSDDPDIWLLFQTICIYPANSDELSISTRWQNGHYPVNPDGAGASRIHSLPAWAAQAGEVVTSVTYSYRRGVDDDITNPPVV